MTRHVTDDGGPELTRGGYRQTSGPQNPSAPPKPMSAASHTTTDQHAEVVRDVIVKCFNEHTFHTTAYPTNASALFAAKDSVEALRVRAAAADTLADALRDLDVRAMSDYDADLVRRALAAYAAATETDA